jgi:hypothetical protein
MTVAIVTFLQASYGAMPSLESLSILDPVQSLEENIDARPVLKSPFENTLAMVRWNSYHPERMPLLKKYTPFYDTVHFSMPDCK